MCTDLRLVRLADLRVSARTLDFAYELGSTVEVVPRGQNWTATKTHGAIAPLSWTNNLGFVGMGAFGFDQFFADGLNEAGLSVGTLWLPETKLPESPPTTGTAPALDFVNLAGWLLGTCSTVADVKAALTKVQIWNAPVKDLWPEGRPVPDKLEPLMNWAFTEHLAIHDASGADLVVEFLDGQAQVHDNVIGVLTNSPVYPWHVTNLRNFIGLTNVDPKPYNLMGMPVTGTGNGTGLMGLPGDVTPPSRFVRATVLTQVASTAGSAREAVNQAFHSLDLVSVPRNLAASGDYTQWYVVRDHDNLVYYVRSYDGWTTDVHDLRALKVDQAGASSTLPLPSV
ncbi:MAG: linear amide C-N hydrolase [Actinomycetes bacterium]